MRQQLSGRRFAEERAANANRPCGWEDEEVELGWVNMGRAGQAMEDPVTQSKE